MHAEQLTSNFHRQSPFFAYDEAHCGLVVPCNLGLADLFIVVYCRQELSKGPMLYIAIVVLITLLYWRESPIGLMVLCLMCGGDGLADIVGRRYGSAKLPFNVKKSWAGSLAMLAGQTEIVILQECTYSTFACPMHKSLSMQPADTIPSRLLQCTCLHGICKCMTCITTKVQPECNAEMCLSCKG